MTFTIRFALVALATLAVVSPAAAAQKLFGLSSFDAIEVQADVIVEVVARAPVNALATGPQAALDRLSIETRDGRLIIAERRFAGDDSRRAARGPVTVQVSAVHLRSATLVSAGSLQIDQLKGQRVMVGLRGPGRLIVGQIVADRLQVTMIGNGTMTLGGTAKQAQMVFSGAGMVDAAELAVDALVSDSEGVGEHQLRAVKSARITARGVGKTVVLGRPTCTVRNIGSGSVTCGTGRSLAPAN